MDELNISVNPSLELKLLQIEDSENLFSLIDADRKHLRVWLSWVDKTNSIEDSKGFIEKGIEKFKNEEAIILGVWWKKQLVGVLESRLDNTNKKVALGYWLSSEFEGEGIMTHSVEALVNYLFKELGFNKVSIHAATENSKSRGVAERLNFKHEGTIRACEVLYDHFEDHEAYSMLASEFAFKG